jgi:hypothetical protein
LVGCCSRDISAARYCQCSFCRKSKGAVRARSGRGACLTSAIACRPMACMVFRATDAVNDLRPLSRHAPEGSASLTASAARNRAPSSDRRKDLVAWLVVVSKLRALSICMFAIAAPSFFDRSPNAWKVARWRSGNEKVQARRQKLRRRHCRNSVAAPTTSDNINHRLPRRIV